MDKGSLVLYLGPVTDGAFQIAALAREEHDVTTKVHGFIPEGPTVDRAIATVT